VSIIRLANAPCSYGAFEITIGVSPNLPGPEEVLTAIAEAGYEGTELGPPGYLGEGQTLTERLERHRLALVGGYIPIRFSEPDGCTEDIEAMAETLDLFEAAGAVDARAVLADAGSNRRRAYPGQGTHDRSLGLGNEGWRRLAAGVRRAAERARARGFEPTFHHHLGSYIEAPWEIERLLELTDVGLLLDTGHLVGAGGDPVQALRDWGQRVDHVHVKDVRRNVLAEVIATRADMTEAWKRNVFCELGAGDVDLEGFFAELALSGYSGWLVIEQDRILRHDESLSEAQEAQRLNRLWLARHAGL
jgi:inosose dehydratase